jgi:hypothetical protein
MSPEDLAVVADIILRSHNRQTHRFHPSYPYTGRL